MSINYPRNTNWIGPLRKNRLIPVFLVHEFAAGGGYPFIGVFELAPLRDWIRAITGVGFSPSAHGDLHRLGPRDDHVFCVIKFYSGLFFFLRLSGFVYDFSPCPVFLVHEFAAGEAYPFIGVFELAPLRGWKLAITGGWFLVHRPMERSIPPSGPSNKNVFSPIK